MQQHHPRLEDRIRALALWRAALGDGDVVDDDATIAALDRAAFDTPRRLFAALRPKSPEQVAECVRIASAHGIALKPISTGKNWGMGSRVPVFGPAALLDLGGLRAIRAFDEELGFVRVEPGVTFADVEAMLEARGSAWCLDVTGSSGHTSLIGNALERGHGLGLMADRAAHVAHLEVVTGRGEIISTGFGGHPENRVADLSRHGVGPALDGLFFQSGMGIVTAMTIWLQRRPPVLWPLTFSPRTADDLPAVVDGLRRLRHEGLRISARLFNDLRALSIMRRYPWDEMDQRTPLDPALRRRLRAEHGLSAWNGVGAIYAFSIEDAQAQRRHLEAALGPVADVAVHPPGEPGTPPFVERVAPTFVGRTIEAALDMAWWRKRTPRVAGVDPVDAGCGLLWICPQVPWRGADVTRLVELVEAEATAHGFEPNIGLLFVTPRVVDPTIALVFDRERAGENAAAVRCRDAIVEGCRAAGFPLYRAGIDTMHHTHPSPANATVLRQIGRVLDPAGVIARGRYGAL